MIGIGAAMGIWTTVTLWMERRINARTPEVLEASDVVSDMRMDGVCKATDSKWGNENNV
jgi:hypothetical protein